MIRRLYLAAAAWATVGLLGGLYYRTLTHRLGVDGGGTQLAVVHTHALALGATWLLVVMALVRVFGLEESPRVRSFFVAWNAGLTLSVGAMLVKGTMQVLGYAAADHPAIAGVSGTGHIVMTVAMTLLFLALAPALPGRANPVPPYRAALADQSGR